jgi:capsular polysaccharide transport system permease protein
LAEETHSVNQPYIGTEFLPGGSPLPPHKGPAADVTSPARSPATDGSKRSALMRLLRRPMFIIAVLIPNLLSILYFGFIASPVYVSTASLVVLNPQKSEPTLTSMLSGSASDASSEQGGYLLKSYLASWQAFTRVEKPLQLANNYSGGDLVSRYGGLTTGFRTNDVALWRYLNRRVTTKIDQKSGILALKVSAYQPRFAHALASAMLNDAVAHMDAMNTEQQRDYVGGALARKVRIEQALQSDLAALARYRQDTGTYDPKDLYDSNLSLLNGLALKEADLKAQRDAISAATPNNPVARSLGSQITSVRGNIDATQRDIPRMARDSALYEKLLVSRDNNISLLSQANMAVQEAQLSVEKARYYLNVVSTPSQPDTPEEPQRLLWIGGIFLASLLLWAVLR